MEIPRLGPDRLPQGLRRHSTRRGHGRGVPWRAWSFAGAAGIRTRCCGHNLGPESFGDFVRQRRRNYAGHLHLKNKYGHKVSSLDNRLVAKVAWREVKSALWLCMPLAVLAFVELLSRVLGSYDYYIRRRTHVIWDMALEPEGDVGAQAPPDQRNGRRAGPASEGRRCPRLGSRLPAARTRSGPAAALPAGS